MKDLKRSSPAIIGVTILIGVLIGGALAYFWLISPTLSGSSVGLSLTLNYEDGGPSKTVEPSLTGLKSLSITDTSGRKLSSVTYTVNVYANWDGTATSTAITGAVSSFVGGVLKEESAFTYNTLLPKTTLTPIKSGSLTASTIEAWSPSPGDKTLTIIASLSLKASFSDGTTNTKSGEGTGTLNYKTVAGGITGLTVTVSPVGVLS